MILINLIIIIIILIIHSFILAHGTTHLLGLIDQNHTLKFLCEISNSGS